RAKGEDQSSEPDHIAAFSARTSTTQAGNNRPRRHVPFVNDDGLRVQLLRLAPPGPGWSPVSEISMRESDSGRADAQTSVTTVATSNGWFDTTHWSAVVTAGEESAQGREALSRLCQTYWYPLYSYVRRSGHNQEDAQ